MGVTKAKPKASKDLLTSRLALTVSEVARLMGISSSTVRQMIGAIRPQ